MLINEICEKIVDTVPITIGYTEDELLDIQSVYGIQVVGQLRTFLLEMGRSDGGVIGDYWIPMYRPSWKLRHHFLFQCNFFNEMQEIKKFEYLHSPFVFSLLSENQYCFVQTKGSDPNRVYRYDSAEEVVYEEKFDLIGFLRWAAEQERRVGKATVGDLLAFR